MTKVKITIETENSSITKKSTLTKEIELQEDADGMKKLSRLFDIVFGSPLSYLKDA